MASISNNIIESERDQTLKSFVELWPYGRVKRMSLDEYVLGGENSKDSFCYYVEFATINLGDIRGGSSFKHGIYIPKGVSELKGNKQYEFKGKYAWHRKYGNEPNVVLSNIKGKILKIIDAARLGDLNAINNIDFSPVVKWKIAFLYSDKKLFPVYKKEALHFIAQHLGFEKNKGASYPQLYDYILKNLDRTKSIFENASVLYEAYFNSLKIKRSEIEPDSQKEDNPSKDNYLNYFPTTFTRNTNPTSKSQIIAKEVYKSLKRINDERGNMFGIFGSWGRGKTYLWELIKNELTNDLEKPFEYIEFHAWKYQDTPASWAYLYEVIVSNFIKGNLVKRYSRIFRYNLNKNGTRNLIISVISLIWIFVGIFLLKMDDWDVYLKNVIKASGFIGLLPFIIQFITTFRKAKKPVRRFLKSYSQIASFKYVLGLQSEIQEELKIILKTWFKKQNFYFKFSWKFWNSIRKKENNRRLIFFIDDIDRCNEIKVIQIVDSLRVMLDDPEISKRVLVVAAIDERILTNAIKYKYVRLLKETNVNNKINLESQLERLANEYMDKLFISGIKLPSMDINEKSELWQNITAPIIELDKISGVVENVETILEAAENELEVSEESRITINEDSETHEEMMENGTLSQVTNRMLENLIQEKSDVTPRQTLIFFHRFLLSINLIKQLFPSESNNWDLERDRILATIIINRTCGEQNEDILSNLEEETKNERFVIAIKEIVDMVIAY